MRHTWCSSWVVDRSSQENTPLSIEEEGPFVVGNLVRFPFEISVGEESRLSCDLDRSRNSKKQNKTYYTKR